MLNNEVVISASNQNIFTWELHSLSLLSTCTEHFGKYPHSIVHTTSGLIAPQGDKTLMHYYQFASEFPQKKSSTIEVITALAASEFLVVGGSVSGQIFVWDCQTGDMLYCWTGHLSKVTKILMVENDLITASSDSMINIYKLSRIYEGNVEPAHVLAHHLMGINDIKCQNGLIFSVSMDKSVKKSNGNEILYEQFLDAEPLSLEVTSSGLYIGLESGELASIDGDSSRKLALGTEPIGCVASDFNQSTVIAAATTVFLVSTNTFTLLRTLKLHTEPVHALLVVPRPPEFSGEIQHFQIKPLKKTLDRPSDKIEFQCNLTFEEPILDNGDTDGGSQRLKNLNNCLYSLLVEHTL